jgi:dihydroorotate dehydrogenase
VAAGADGISAINTILCTIGIDLETFRPLPCVEGYSEPGGYSGRAVRPIALRQVMECARACPGVPISGMGGIESAADAAQFLLVGASTVQICTGAMLYGYGIIAGLCRELSALLDARGLARAGELVGKSLPYFTTHAELVALQRAAEHAGHPNRDGLWQGDIARETDALVGE